MKKKSRLKVGTVWMFMIEGCSAREIAEFYGVSLQIAKSEMNLAYREFMPWEPRP